MADILLRSIPEADAVRIAANAARAGVSQAQYLRAVIHEAARQGRVPLDQLAGSATGAFPDGVLVELDEEWEA